jgi:1A family penicillin-binding protein
VPAARQTLPKNMRLILVVLFIILIFLLKIEDSLRWFFSIYKKLLKKSGKKYSHFQKTTTKIVQKHTQNLKTNTLSAIHQLKIKLRFIYAKSKGRKKKKHNITLIPFKSKLKYFSLGIFFSFIFLFLPIVILVFLQDLPSPNELTLRQIPQTTKIFDKNGILLAQIYTTQNRTVIPLSDIPKHLQQATLAIEDKNFYKHPGFDIPSIIRAISVNIAGKNIQGGSTITQQLIKSSILTPEQSISRKLKELILAFWTERIYTKNQILEMYFNQVPYGGTAWGAEAGAQTYFNKHALDLDLAQSAFLAGLTSAPTTYSPYGNNPDLWQRRQKEVLTRMVSLDFISQKEAEEAEKEKLTFKEQQTAIHAPHFVAYIKELLAQKYGLPMLEKGGLNITTSLDLKTQEMAEKIVKEEVDNNAYLNLTNGASLITDPQNGDILAMVGSKDFNDPNSGNFNVATSIRQPGSSIKIVTYAAALEHGFTAASILEDTPISYPTDSGPYSPVNYDGKFHGKVPLRLALANSLNIPAVKTLNQIGVPSMVNMGKKMGISSWGDPKEYGLSITLGAAEVTMLDMATVYGTLANDGNRVNLNPILKITDSRGNVLEQKTHPQSQLVLEKGVAFILSDILADNQARTMEFGPNSPLNIPGHVVSVKTGTTDNKRDNWTDGFTNNYVVIVWVGNNNNAPMSPNLASGITGAAPIWHKIMENLLSKTPETKPDLPPEVIQKICSGRIEYLLKRTENTPGCKPIQTYSVGKKENL